jgi:hypothetical protein
MEALSILAFVLNVAIATAFGAACFGAWRWILRLCRPVGLVVGLGIVVRAGAGIGLFLVSYLNLPVLASIHTGDGFWHLAPDARVYYGLAADAAAGAPVPAGSPSPVFLETLGLWLWATGPVPVSAVLFNLALYVASCVLLTMAFRPETGVAATRAAVITVSAMTFSPLLILLSTQPLKDVFSVFLIVLAGSALARMLRTAPRMMLHWTTLLPVGAVALAVFLMAGVRPYYALFIWAAVALALMIALAGCRRALKVRWAGFGAGVLAVLWAAFMWGAGPYYVFYGDLVTRTIGVHLPSISPDAGAVAALPPTEGEGLEGVRNSVHALRDGFVNSGGATNLVSESGASLGEIEALMVGLAALFLPISALIQLSVVEFSGGRGFLFVADLDTVFLDLALLAVVWVAVSAGRPERRQLPFMGFAVALGLTSALLMAYVVTNYGTVVRLRLLAAVPLWLVPLALSHARTTAPLRVPLERGLDRPDDTAAAGPTAVPRAGRA